MYNSLKIKEPLLLKYHNQICECLVENNIEFEAEYQFEPDSKSNSNISYSITAKTIPRYGFITVNDNKFCGAICKTEVMRYLDQEGFNDEQINKEPIFALSTSVMGFISMLAIPMIDQLKFSPELKMDYRAQYGD